MSTANTENIDFEPPAPWLTPSRRKALIVAVFVAVIAAWQLVVSALGISHLIFPGPAGVARSIYDVFQSGEVWPHLWVTLYEILAGFALGAFAGFLLGALIGQSALLELVLYPYVVAFQTVPKVAVAPLFVLWFGFDTTSKVVITATIVFFPVLANTIVGLRSAPRDQIDLMRAFTASSWHVFRMVRLPHALPYVFAGLDIGIVLAVIGAIVGEFVGAQAGLGYLILQRNFSMDAAGMFAILIVLSAIGIVLHGLMKAIARRVVFWADAFTDLSRGT
ncbi:ABC transporter permease [Variovorax sp. OV084]|jgi:NitT/TauT family transport system permease protein|uniref:ABC transporter permease n=1 Tax=unclassified Variovorax TaxID=663243 RepID=UPI0008CB1F3D|nr:ABC transporter permease [Variovorax sp. OV084]SEU11032.1 NitT/TauT family transport system permease protein [Variovorax sp. OV084]